MTERVDSYLFGIDLDGTLLSPTGLIADRTRLAIRAILDAGHRVAFATGRNYTEASKIFDIVEHRDLVVLVSGALVVDAKSGKTVHRAAMDPILAGELCGAIERHGHAAVAYVDRHHMGFDYLVSEGRIVHEALSSWMSLSDQRLERRSEMARQDHSHTLRVSTVLDVKAAAELKAAIMLEFGKRTYVHGVLVMSQGVEIVEMFDPHVNKWLGLKYVADFYGIAPDRIITFGDDQNDLPMIRHAAFGVAMGNARVEVKQIAKRVIGTNAEDGLAVYLEQWLRDPEAAMSVAATPE
ncbi:MAG: Cof-type HAD-IIB family hydrolase [Burkholderiales bacterium]|nr:Cof-type HAD-IIB family hydrolase [Phycisphaerae bacterium]